MIIKMIKFLLTMRDGSKRKMTVINFGNEQCPKFNRLLDSGAIKDYEVIG